MRTYLVVSAAIFGAVALMHVLRLSLAWSVELAGWMVPLWFSWIGLAVAGALCIWGLRLAIDYPASADLPHGGHK